MNIIIVAGQIICDFCSSTPVVARYHADTFVVKAPGPVVESVGDWAACHLCSRMIDTGDFDALLDHAVVSFTANPGYDIPAAAVREFLEDMYAQLRQADFRKVAL